MSLVTKDDFKGYEHVSNINKEYLKKDMAVPDVTATLLYT
jgi:hypothetical protein